MSGNEKNLLPNYGIMYGEAPSNSPGWRESAETWINKEGNLCMFGGWNRDDEILGDFWCYNLSPSKPKLAAAPDEVLLLNPGYYLSKNKTPTVQIRGLGIGSRVELYKDAECKSLLKSLDGVTAKNVNIVTPELEDGDYHFAAKQVDIFGNVSPCSLSVASYKVDSSFVNSAPSFTNPAQNFGEGTQWVFGDAPVGEVGWPISTFTEDFLDQDPNAVAGIAVVSADQSKGTWYYTSDAGAQWTVLEKVSMEHAKLLVSDEKTRLYYRPNDFKKEQIASTLEVKAWDRSDAAHGDLVNTTGENQTAFSVGSKVLNFAQRKIPETCSVRKEAGCAVQCPAGEHIGQAAAYLGSENCDNLPDHFSGTHICKVPENCIGRTSCSYVFDQTKCGRSCNGSNEKGLLVVDCVPTISAIPN